MVTVNSRMLQRRGTAASWTGANPTLSSGEIGYETDTGKAKVGDGSTVWTLLEYVNSKDEFSAYEVAVSAGFTGSTITVPLGTERITSSSTYTLASDEVTIATAGRHFILADVSVEIASGSGTTEAEIWLEIDTVEVAGTRASLGLRGGAGASGSISTIVDFAASEVLRMRTVRTTGTATLQTTANGVRLSMGRLF